MSAEDIAYVEATFERCSHVEGPFYHGTKSALDVGDQLVPGRGSNYHEGRSSNHSLLRTTTPQHRT